jgi:hypothetical protein
MNCTQPDILDAVAFGGAVRHLFCLPQMGRSKRRAVCKGAYQVTVAVAESGSHGVKFRLHLILAQPSHPVHDKVNT